MKKLSTQDIQYVSGGELCRFDVYAKCLTVTDNSVVHANDGYSYYASHVIGPDGNLAFVGNSGGFNTTNGGTVFVAPLPEGYYGATYMYLSLVS